jgi:2-haloacid dehalogenase
MEDFADFAAVTRDSLVYSLRVAGITPTEALISEVETAYLQLSLVPDPQDALHALEGHTRAIFSNGSMSMLNTLVHNSGLEPLPST